MGPSSGRRRRTARVASARRSPASRVRTPAAVEPREILKECLLRGAAAVALLHTHPSGDPTPSMEDRSFTRRMADAAAVMGVEMVDHLVLGVLGHWVSVFNPAGHGRW
jgi:proteasome lid subunit RPN8/RPN11